MRDFKIAYRYARALFNLAQDNKKTDVVYGNISDLCDLLRKTVVFENFISSPAIPIPQKEEVLEGVLKKDFQELTVRFIDFLIEKDRVDQLPLICDAFMDIYHEEKGIWEARIIVAKKITEAQVKAICDRLKKRFHKDIRPTVTVEPALIGGFKIQTGTFTCDYSLKAQLQRLKERILAE